MIFLVAGLGAAVVYLLVKSGSLSLGSSQPARYYPGNPYIGPNAQGSYPPGYQPGGQGNNGYNPAVNPAGFGQAGLGIAGAAGAPASALGPAGAALGVVGLIGGIIGAKHQEAVKKEASVSNGAVKDFYNAISQIFEQAKQARFTQGVLPDGGRDRAFPVYDQANPQTNPSTWETDPWGLGTAVDQAYSAWTAAIQPIRKSGNGPDVVDTTWIVPARDGFKFVLHKMVHGLHGNTMQDGGYLPAIPDHAGFLGAQRVDFSY